MKLPITIHQARLGTTEFKVIRPARPWFTPCSSITTGTWIPTSIRTQPSESAGYGHSRLFTAFAGPPADAGAPWPLPTGSQKTAHDSLISCCCTTRSSSPPHAGRKYEDGSAQDVRRP